MKPVTKPGEQSHPQDALCAATPSSQPARRFRGGGSPPSPPGRVLSHSHLRD